MKKYRLELRSRYGERYNVTVTANTYCEAEEKIMLPPGWWVESYSIVGVSV